MTTNQDLTEFVAATAERFGIPGVAVGVFANGEEQYACHGVTSVANPLPVDPDTVFVLGSVTKTFTATALMRLVARGDVDLHAPVSRYVPEFHLGDAITVLQLLNHSSGLPAGPIFESGAGDDALARVVANLATLDVIAQPGERASYSQAGLNVVGRIIEKVTGLTYERAIAELLFEPLRLQHSFYLPDDVMTRRFAVGHNVEGESMNIARLRKRTRGDNPGGGAESSVADMVRWGRFHLGDGESILPAAVLRQMQEPTIELPGSSLGDAIGIGWFLRDVNGLRTVGHGGSTNGQFAELLIAPDHGFVVVSMANSSPNGIPFNQAIVRWAMEHYLGIVETDPEPLPYDPEQAHLIVGSYDMASMVLTIRDTGSELTMDCRIKPEIRAAAETELPPDIEPAVIGLLPGAGDGYIVTEGSLQGQRGFFTRDDGLVVGVDLAGRLSQRV